MYESLTKLIPDIDSAGKPWHAEGQDNAPTRPLEVELEHRIENFVRDHPEEDLTHYADILNRSGIEWSAESMKHADVSRLDGRTVLALLVGTMRAERFSYGIFLEFLQSGTVKRWLQRLQMIDAGQA